MKVMPIRILIHLMVLLIRIPFCMTVIGIIAKLIKDIIPSIFHFKAPNFVKILNETTCIS